MSDHFAALLQTIHTLRSPGGCPWDQKQNLVDAARYLMDECGELVESALEGDPEGCEEELGDILFMVSFCTEILSETYDTDMHKVAFVGNEKLIRRHPHVFGDSQARDTEESQERWNAIKADEKRAKGIDPTKESAIKAMPASTAPLHVAYKFQKNAAGEGFDWPEISGVWEKLREELGELEEAAAGTDKDALEHELGDLLFSVVNLSRWLKIQPDMALRKANNRFRQRFGAVENEYRAEDKILKEATIEELEEAWQRAKKLTDQELTDQERTD